MLQDFRVAAQPIEDDNIMVRIKGIKKDGSDSEEIKMSEMKNKIKNSISNHNVDKAVNAFNNDKGPNNAVNMVWPAFKGNLEIDLE